MGVEEEEEDFDVIDEMVSNDQLFYKFIEQLILEG